MERKNDEKNVLKLKVRSLIHTLCISDGLDYYYLGLVGRTQVSCRDDTAHGP